MAHLTKWFSTGGHKNDRKQRQIIKIKYNTKDLVKLKTYFFHLSLS